MNLIVKYVYDAWGNQKAYVLCNKKYLETTVSNSTTEFSNNKTIATLNPFRYRGYYYDEESKLYYLNSRYYDPEVGRFINSDDMSILMEAQNIINGLNLYAYCDNNPIMNIDYNGNFALGLSIVIGLLVGGAIFGSVSLGKKSSSEGNIKSKVVKDSILGASLGLAAVGAIMMLGSMPLGLAIGINTAIYGITAAQIFAIGALAFNFTAMFIAPIYGFEMQAVEYEESISDKYDTTGPSKRFPNIDTMGYKNLGSLKNIVNLIGANKWTTLKKLCLKVNYQLRIKNIL